VDPYFPLYFRPAGRPGGVRSIKGGGIVQQHSRGSGRGSEEPGQQGAEEVGDEGEEGPGQHRDEPEDGERDAEDEVNEVDKLLEGKGGEGPEEGDPPLPAAGPEGTLSGWRKQKEENGGGLPLEEASFFLI
jgi:hypothetical protein